MKGTVDRVDLHSHLVPGVDDGARTVEEALEGLRLMRDAGIRTAVTTPHFDASLTRDSAALNGRLAAIDDGWSALRAAAAERVPEVDLRRGLEVKLDADDGDFSDARLRMAGTSFVLVEWPFFEAPRPRHGDGVADGSSDAGPLERLAFSGLTPVLAHPERYRGLDRELAGVRAWRDGGARLQVNYGSLLGRYGSRARTIAFRLLRRGWVDYLATDHHPAPGAALQVAAAWERLEALGGEERVRLLGGTNPARLLRDEPPLPVPGFPEGRGYWERVRQLFD